MLLSKNQFLIFNFVSIVEHEKGKSREFNAQTLSRSCKFENVPFSIFSASKSSLLSRLCWTHIFFKYIGSFSAASYLPLLHNAEVRLTKCHRCRKVDQPSSPRKRIPRYTRKLLRGIDCTVAVRSSSYRKKKKKKKKRKKERKKEKRYRGKCVWWFDTTAYRKSLSNDR